MKDTVKIPSVRRRIIFYSIMENLMYWFTGSIVWIPWYFSDVLGMAAMLFFVPLTMAAAAFYCLKRVPVEIWKKEIWIIIGVFIITTALIDLFFWVLWRGHNVLEWYLPTNSLGIANFIGYLEIVIISLVVYVLALKTSRLQKWQFRYLSDLKIVAFVIVFFIFNVYFAITYW